MAELARLQNIGLFSCLFSVVLLFGFAVETVRGNLEGDDLFVSLFLLIFCMLCVPGLCLLTNGGTSSVRVTCMRLQVTKVGLWLVVVSVFAQQLMLIILSLLEWADPDCERDVLAVCAGQRTNFLAMVGVVTLLHVGYFLFWRTLLEYWRRSSPTARRPMADAMGQDTGSGDWPSVHRPFFTDREDNGDATDAAFREDSSVSSGGSLKDGVNDILIKEI